MFAFWLQVKSNTFQNGVRAVSMRSAFYGKFAFRCNNILLIGFVYLENRKRRKWRRSNVAFILMHKRWLIWCWTSNDFVDICNMRFAHRRLNARIQVIRCDCIGFYANRKTDFKLCAQLKICVLQLKTIILYCSTLSMCRCWQIDRSDLNSNKNLVWNRHFAVKYHHRYNTQ